MSILDKKTLKLKVHPQFWVIHEVLQLKMTVYTCRIENCWSFFNFSFCFRDFNEVLFHKKYTKIIDKSSKNGLSSEPFFLDFLNESLPRSFLHLKALEMSFSKLVLHAQKVHLIKELWLFKVCLWKTKF